ncbi:CBL-interacting serine/threonine-protein kinase 24 [Podila clonocystis]|nr:CBL-interacting serine/threonine-protein kinase 24 [Podila clonocystis]
MSNDVPNFASSSRKIYPGLKNTVGPYKLLHSIGQGSFSQVKMAVDTRTGDHVAIKVMSRAMIQSSDRLGISVKRESDLLKSIEHPNIIGFREVVESSLQTCIVLDYASGGELFEFVADKRPLASEADIQYIFAQIVDAVDYLHAHNIVHRDLKLEKPRNGAPLRPKVKLTDFGLAKVIEQGAPLLTTRCGSEDYAAPEIILGQPYDGRQADIWSLGVVLYALLVGFLPFNMRPGMNRKGFLSMIAHAEFGFPGDRVPTKRISQSNLYAASQSQSQAQTSESKDSTGTLLPAANDGALSAPDTMVVPKMNGVGPVSSESKELVRWLLQTQGSRRPTARELWEHPWVAAGRQAVHDSK